MSAIYESEIEEMTIGELVSEGYEYVSGPDIAPGTLAAEREDYSDVVLKGRLLQALKRINPGLPYTAILEAYKKITNISSPSIVSNNEDFHHLLIDGISVEFREGSDILTKQVILCDFANVENNDFLAVNQFSVEYRGVTKRPDVIIFINGLPVVLFELKNAADENATVKKAYEQIETYKECIPALFTYNEVCIISDGLESKAGSLTASFSRFTAWKTKDGLREADKYESQLATMIHGMLAKNTLLDYIRFFITFEKSREEDKDTKIVTVKTVKKNAAYHQYYAVNKAIVKTIEAEETRTKKAGVIWHTQGAGKSLSMVFYAGKLIQVLDNPTILVINDRNDLDDQLFNTFSDNSMLLRQTPKQAEDCDDLRKKLDVASGGVIFSTIQKFIPEKDSSVYETINTRKNIVVIADEAHRTQYGFDAKIRDVKDENKNIIGQKISYGFAKYIRDALPEATFIGFTGTPVEKDDANTPAVFGHYIDIYDINQAVEDKVTVKIYYESRLAKVNITEEGKRLIEEFDDSLEQDEVTEEDENTDKGAKDAKKKWSTLEKIVGNQERIENVAADIIQHFESRQETLAGKAMIVAMSRRIAAELYEAIIKLRPEWHDSDLNKGVIKVVMTTNSADGPALQKHHTTKTQRKALALRMRDENDPLKIVIVRDMWLTGFDAPCLNTMYIDKPMHEHNLMQAIARVNRVFKDKPGGLIVDYIGIGTSLKKALSFYANSGGKGIPAESQERAVDILKEKMEILDEMFSGFDYSDFFNAGIKDRLSVILRAEDYVLGLPDGKNRFIKQTTLLSQAFALAKPHPATFQLAERVAFYQAVKARLSKFENNNNDGGEGNGRNDYDSIIKNIVDSAIESNEVIDVFSAAGLEKPEISILSDEFLEEVKNMQYKNVAIAMLQKLLEDEVRIRSKFNITQSKSLMDMLDSSIKRYQNNLLTTAQIIEELIELAKELKKADERGEKLNLRKDELAFYDALEVNDSAVAVLGDEQLRQIARELADKVRKNATIDWTMKESVRAKLMVLVRRTLKKYGYPPDKQEKAVKTVLQQAENLADYWTK